MLFKVAAVVLASLAPSALALWPMPHSLTEGSKTLILSYGFQIELQGALSGYGAPDDFKAAGESLFELCSTSILFGTV